jgi:hypothetical protein
MLRAGFEPTIPVFEFVKSTNYETLHYAIFSISPNTSSWRGA